MSTKSIVLDEQQKARLTELASDTIDPSLANRAKAVLARSEGKTIMMTATELNVNKDFVSRWEERFLEGGIDALYSRHGGGQTSSVDDPDLDQKIIDLVETRKDTHWSKKEVADELGIKVAKLDYELGKLGITTMRNTSWEFDISDTLCSRNLCPAGLYLSGSARCLVFCSSSAGILKGGAEHLTTRDRLLAEELHTEDGSLTLKDALQTAAEFASDKPKKRSLSLTDFLLDLEQSLPEDDSVLCIAITQSDSPISYRGKRPERLVFHMAGTVDSWLNQSESALLQMALPGNQKAPQQLMDAIRHLIDSSKATTDPIVWTKKVTIDSEVHDVGTKETEQKPQLQAPGPDSMEKAVLKALGQDRPLQEKEIRCAMIPVVLDSDGIHYSVVTAKQEFPRADAFGFSSQDAFMKGFNQMEQRMIDLRDRAGEQCAQMYVDAVKKKNTTAE